MSRRTLVFGALVVVLAGAIAATVVVLGRRDGTEELTRPEYVARVSAICRRYERRLARIPPPTNFANPREVVHSVSRALPLVRERLATVRAVDPPEELEAQVARFLGLNGRANARLDALLAAARAGNRGAMGRALLEFLEAREAARRDSAAIGFRC
jgi:hypothetical protein